MPTQAEIDAEYENAELRRRVDQLEATVNALKEAGLDRLIESGLLQFDGIPFRWDSHGMQVESNGSSINSLWFVNRLVPSLSAEAGAFHYLSRLGASVASTGPSSLTASAFGPSASDTYAIASSIQSNNAGTVEAKWTLDQGGDQSEVVLNRPEAATIANLTMTNVLFRVGAFTSDPGTLTDGDIWYRSDTDKFRARANSTTHNLATETLVTDHTGDTSDAHDASAISITDSGGYFTGTDVEAALQELGAAAGGSSMPMPPVVGPHTAEPLATAIAKSNYSAVGSAAWPTSNLAIYFPVLVTEDCTIVKLWCYNGATASGNVCVAVYNSAYTRIVTSGSTAQAGTNVLQEFDVADTAITAGLYYVGIAMDNTTGTVFQSSHPSTEYAQMMGCATQASAFALPDPMVPAAAAADRLPMAGFSIRTLVT